MKLLSVRWIPLSLLLTAAVFTARGEIPRIDPKQDTLQAVLDRIHDHAANDNWKKDGFTDEAIEKWLDKIVGVVAKAAEFPELKLPVRFADVNPDGLQVGRILKSALLVGTDINLKGAVDGSIVLADGSVEADGRIENSVIVARGAIILRGISSTSVLVSGGYAAAQLDGQPGNAANGSLILSRGWARVRSGYGTMVAAPEGITGDRIRGGVYINAPAPGQPIAIPGALAAALGETASRSLQIPGLPLGSLPTHSMVSRIEVTGVVHAAAPETDRILIAPQALIPRGIVFRFGDQTLVAELNQPILDEDGKPMELLRNWKLACVNEKMALFVGPDGNAVLRLEKK